MSEHTDDSRAFAAEILDKAGVAVTPGLDFDPVRGHQTLRFSYARATEDIVEGLERLARFMADRQRLSSKINPVIQHPARPYFAQGLN